MKASKSVWSVVIVHVCLCDLWRANDSDLWVNDRLMLV